MAAARSQFQRHNPCPPISTGEEILADYLAGLSERAIKRRRRTSAKRITEIAERNGVRRTIIGLRAKIARDL